MRFFLLAVTIVLCFAQIEPVFADPTLTVTEARRGTWSFTGLGYPYVIIDDPAGCDAVPWVFTWQAIPEPGRTIDAYRYGFDILDLNDDDQWATDWGDYQSAPPHSFFFGTHEFHVEVRDDTGAITRGSFKMNIIPIETPTLTLAEPNRGTWVFVGPDSPPVSLSEPVSDPAVPWEFEWSALPCGQNPGTLEYRYGWDIADPDDDSQWTPWGSDLSAPSQTLMAGVHTFMVETRDQNGMVTRGTVFMEITSGPVSVEKTTWGGIKSKYTD
ncbi:MAG: hypothetical protein JSW50_15760 [Candidatus Latescibacterota bacterium]|nr:MAG: hypothetical protein JSW50_15760 [Candidatus Latescibacterota bacterium]